MEGLLKMSTKERRRMAVLGEVKAGRLKVAGAAEAMGLSYRQAKRVWKRYAAKGDAGLTHGLRGRPSGRRKDPKLKARVLKRYRERYGDFGPTLATQYLAKEGMVVDHETLRRWLKETGEWRPRRRRQKHRQWRERKESFGQMVQMDGSEHDWFEGRRGRAVVMVAVDDATNRVMARFFEGETTHACYDLMEGWIRRHGVPQSLYVDRDSIYRCERVTSVAEQVAGEVARTQFGRAMKELGVELILANSPQAKGRVERTNGTLQDRLVKGMRLAGIKDLEAANKYLEGVYLPDHNRRFTVKAGSEADVHRGIPRELERILSWAEKRQVQRDWTVLWEGRWFQIGREHQGLNLVGQAVEIRRLRDDRILVLKGEQALRWKELPGRPMKAHPKPKAAAPRVVKRPSADHPWKRYGGTAREARKGRR
jgi:transposase